MIAGALTKDIGVMASDSSIYDSSKGVTIFESPKLAITSGKTIISFVGSHLFFSNIDSGKFSMPFDSQCLYLADYLAKTKDAVTKLLNKEDSEFSLHIMGLHKGFPKVAKLNSKKNFEPVYQWSENGLEFYGGDKEYMDKKVKKVKRDLSPGILGEILTRGIYRSVEVGGVVNVAYIGKDGNPIALSGVTNG